MNERKLEDKVIVISGRVRGGASEMMTGSTFRVIAEEYI